MQADYGTRLGRWEGGGAVSGREERREERREEAASWRRIERDMAADEAILFGGLTLARLTGIRALRHRVFTDGHVRLSAPFFQRPSLDVALPAAPPSHVAETVGEYSNKIRDASEEELGSDGVVRLRPRRPRSPPPKPRPYSARDPPRDSSRGPARDSARGGGGGRRYGSAGHPPSEGRSYGGVVGASCGRGDHQRRYASRDDRSDGRYGSRSRGWTDHQRRDHERGDNERNYARSRSPRASSG